MKELERERLRVREIERAVLEDKEDRGIRRKAEATIEEIVNKGSTIGYLSLQGKGRSRYIYLYNNRTTISITAGSKPSRHPTNT